ncbi:hypothetical protein BOX15_Mlig006193g2 [Macrostomum lignano]|uniref:Uncharacterized protein n=1 Tax=Macrostomum lignano TaxID=282301 RepID=A0A267DDE3_9PLAT|nr:hypothetical protein BOX15_Mlig006193g2 [Macrostomum lignano]
MAISKLRAGQQEAPHLHCKARRRLPGQRDLVYDEILRILSLATIKFARLYVSKPLLIDGYKFRSSNLRVGDELRSAENLVFKEGLARFTTVKYKDPTAGNLENVFMHLTNYAVQKNRKDFVRNDEEGGTKRRISTINRWCCAEQL